ncbi:MAG TPA: DUF3192 domain-containing protein [Gemmatimonadaceae bacterium]
MLYSRGFRGASAAIAVVALSACQDRNLRQLTVGMPRDSVISILGQGATSTDSTPNVYREERYLYNGQWITMLMYTNTGTEEGQGTVAEEDLVPVVLKNDTLTGWGWAHHDSVALANNIEIKPRAK